MRIQVAHGLSSLLLLTAALLAGCQSSAGRPEKPQAGQASLPPEVVKILARKDLYKDKAPAPQADAAPQSGAPKTLSIPLEGGSESPRNDGIHDDDNQAIAILQDPAVAMAAFPRDRRQQVDWVATLAAGLIEPRADLLGQTQMQVLDLDVMMKNTQFMPWVRFPHKPHTKWLACSNCHPAIFLPQEGANDISMNKVLRGEYCGVCHDKVAFSLFVCERCHSVPHEGSGKKWW